MSQTNVTKIEDKELQSIHELKTKIQDKIYHFGMLYLERMELDNKSKFLQEQEQTYQKEWLELRKNEETILTDITKKYGEGDLNLTTGVYTKV